MNISDAVFTLETYGRHRGNRFIDTSADKSHEPKLLAAVSVLEKAGMIERDTHPRWAHCNVRIINKPTENTDFT